ncbi:MAG: MarR family winged helix-turn-helix transcriptional regulator [Erysipelotrichaceae bacterium]
MEPSNFIEQQYRLMLHISQIHSQIANKHGLSLNAMWCFLALDERHILTQRDLAQHFNLSKSTIHSITQELLRKHCIQIVPGSNKKEKHLIPTSNSCSLRSAIIEDLSNYEGDFLNFFGEATLVQTERLIHQMIGYKHPN